ncbi:radical SAM protein [Streptosporangium sp. NPDC020072]|uniref:radical SAM protein n=1 Tax=Streptosporangium sp. NPDC020072 TaxID=3154788 RepID=UPI003416429F
MHDNFPMSSVPEARSSTARRPALPAVRDTYPMLGLISSAFPYRMPGPRFGVYGSLVMVAPCNMACSYCDVGGYAKDERHYLPGWNEMSLTTIRQFVRDEVSAGRIIYLTGGEPLMFPELVVTLGDEIRQMGGYSVVCTNASLSGRLEQVSPYIDEFSVSLKGNEKLGEAASGLKGKLAFQVPRRNMIALTGLPNTIEIVVVMFAGLAVEDIVDIYRPLFGRAAFVFKEYRHKATVAHEDHTYTSSLIDLPDEATVRPMPREEIRSVYEELCARHPEHAKDFALVLGGGGEQVVVTSTGEGVFKR